MSVLLFISILYSLILNAMSKLSNTDLFVLIKSLNMSEKRNFKIFASRHVIGEENNYVSLFDDIEKQKEYDEDILLKDERYKKHLPTLKTRLHETILKSLDSFHNNSSVANKLNTQLHFAEILYKKGLYDQSEKVLSKAKTMALKYESFSQLIEIYNWEMKILSIHSFSGTKPNEIKEMYGTILETLDKTSNSFQYIQLSALFGSQRAYSGITRQDINYYKELFENKLYKTPANAKSFIATFHYFFGRCFYYFILNDYSKAYKEVYEAVKLFEKNPHQIPEYPALYAVALFNLSTCQSKMGMNKEALKQIELVKNICAEYPETPINIYSLAASNEIGILTKIGEFKKATELVPSLMSIVDKKLESKAIEIFLYHTIAQAYFGAEMYSEAKKWINKILNETSELREDLYCVEKILNLIVHYELGNNDLLEYLVKSSFRFLYKKKRLLAFENLILKFMQLKVPKFSSEKETQLAFIELKKDLENLFKKQPEDKHLLGYFDFVSWINSKIERVSFAQIIKSKYNKKN